MQLERQPGGSLGIDIRNQEGIAFRWDPREGRAEILASCHLAAGWDRNKVFADPERLGEVLSRLDSDVRKLGIPVYGYVLCIPDSYPMKLRMRIDQTAEELDIPLARMVEESTAAAIYACSTYSLEGSILVVRSSGQEIACTVFDVSGGVMETRRQKLASRRDGLRKALAFGMLGLADAVLTRETAPQEYVLSTPSVVVLLGGQREIMECREYLQMYFQCLRESEAIRYLSGETDRIVIRGTARYAQILLEHTGDLLLLNSMTPHRLFLQGGESILPIDEESSIPFTISISELLTENPGRRIALLEEDPHGVIRPIRHWTIPDPVEDEEADLFLSVNREKQISLLFEEKEVADGNQDRKVPDTQGTSETLLRFMEVADSLEYGIQGISDPEDAHLAGLKNILRQMTDIFAAYGIERYGRVGETFDPKIHNAVYHITDIDLPEQSIHQVVQSGYRSGERILRFASVVVAN